MRDCFAWVCGCVVLVVAAGCSLERVGLGGGSEVDAGPGFDGGQVDGGGADGGRTDGGTACTPGSCDDGTPCTNDTCNPATGCVFTPVPGSCDDGDLCNGADSCADGSCSVHDGVDPCPGSTTCDPVMDACVGCVTGSDCPGEMPGDWGACEYDAGNVCAVAGVRSRTVRSYTCGATRTCDPEDRVETEPCTRVTDGIVCGAVTMDDWGTCGGFSGTCGETGMQSRVVRTPRCGGGACSTASAMETQACTRETDGTSCGGSGCGDWGPCLTETVCSGTGIRARTCGDSSCAGGSCAMTARTEAEACTASSGSRCLASAVCGDCHDPGSATCTGTNGVRDCTYTVGTCNAGGVCMSPGGSMSGTFPCRCGVSGGGG